MVTREQQNKAVDKIKAHLKKRGHEWVEVNPRIALYWWHQLNKALFGGLLRPPRRFHCRNFHKDYGWCHGYKSSLDVEIGIYREPDDRKLFFTILTHEMTHQFQRLKLEPMSHEGTFLQWERYATNILDIPLTVT